MLISKHLTMEIGNYNMKILQVSRVGTKLTIDNALIFPTPVDSVEDGRIGNQEELARVIQEKLKTEKIKVKDIVITISSTSIITREVTLPKATDKELRAIIEMNAPEYFPINIENYILDFKVLKELKMDGGAQLRLLLVAAPQTLIDDYVALATACNLNIISIDYAGNSIYKLINREVATRTGQQKQNNDKTIAVIDIGGNNTVVTILSEGVLEFSRVLLYGSKNIDMILANTFFIPVEDAERQKIEKGQLIYDDDETEDFTVKTMSDSIRSVVINFVDDISRFFEYYSSRKSNNRIDHIYLTGAGSQIKGLDKYFERAFNIKTEHLGDLKSIRVSPKCRDFAKHQASFGVCIGAGLSS